MFDPAVPLTDRALQRTQRRVVALAATTALAAAAAFGSLPPLAHSADGGAVVDARASSPGGLVLHWKAKPYGGDGANVVNEYWASTAKHTAFHMITRNLDDSTYGVEDWGNPFVSVLTRGPVDRPISQRVSDTRTNCLHPDRRSLSSDSDYAKTLSGLWRNIDGLRADATKRAALPAGPVVEGQATVEAIVVPPSIGLMAPPALYVDYDTKTGSVLRTREGIYDGTAWRPGPSYQDYSRWELKPATKSTLAPLAPPAALTKRCSK